MGLVMFSSLAIIEMEILLKQAPDWASGYSKEGNLTMQDWISQNKHFTSGAKSWKCCFVWKDLFWNACFLSEEAQRDRMVDTNKLEGGDEFLLKSAPQSSWGKPFHTGREAVL